MAIMEKLKVNPCLLQSIHRYHWSVGAESEILLIFTKTFKKISILQTKIQYNVSSTSIKGNWAIQMLNNAYSYNTALS